jgi:hypothetical protein
LLFVKVGMLVGEKAEIIMPQPAQLLFLPRSTVPQEWQIRISKRQTT